MSPSSTDPVRSRRRPPERGERLTVPDCADVYDLRHRRAPLGRAPLSRKGALSRSNRTIDRRAGARGGHGAVVAGTAPADQVGEARSSSAPTRRIRRMESIPSGSTRPVGSDIDIANGIAKLMGVEWPCIKNDHLRLDHRRAHSRRSATRSSARMNEHGVAAQAGRLRRLPQGRACRSWSRRATRRSIWPVLAQPRRQERRRSRRRRRERDFLAAAFAKLVKAGQEGDLDQDLPEGHRRRVRAARRAASTRTSRDSPVVLYYIVEGHKSVRRSAGSPIHPHPDRDRDPQGRSAHRGSSRKALKAMYANGPMKKILGKWDMLSAVSR